MQEKGSTEDRQQHARPRHGTRDLLDRNDASSAQRNADEEGKNYLQTTERKRERAEEGTIPSLKWCAIQLATNDDTLSTSAPRLVTLLI